MEIKKCIKAKIKQENGGVFFIFTIIMMILMTMALIVMEYYRVIETHDTIITEMERAGNIAVEYAMIDEARGYLISYIDVDEAKNEFDSYFKARLDLNHDFEKIVDGRRLYKVEFSRFDIDEAWPGIAMEGNIIIDLQLVGKYMNQPVTLPFRVVAMNVNTND